MIDGKPLSNNILVDEVHSNTGSNATLFVKISKGFLRVSTNVKKADGSRAIGTYIPNDSPVVTQLLKGQPFYGRAFVVNDWYITAYEPLFNSKKEVVGAVYIGTKETSLAQIKNYIKSQVILKTGYYYVFDDEGVMIIHPTLEGKNVLEETDVDGNKIFQKMMKNDEGSIDYRWKTPEGAIISKTSLYTHFPLMKWHIVASFNTDEVKDGLTELKIVIFGFMFISLIIMGIFVAWYAKKTSNLLDAVTQKITHATDLINEQSQMISNVSVKLSDSAGKQAAALQETVSTVDEITATVQTNLETTKHSQGLSREVQVITANGFKVMEKLNGAVNKVSDENKAAKAEIQNSYREIGSIVELIKTIDEKTKIINDIVFQTKLLSFNASVEAARAGEHGKGFAVVAEEIGKLASMTGISAIDIQETLSSTSDKVKDIIAKSEKNVFTAFESSSKEITTCTSISSEGITSLEDIKANVSLSAQSMDNLIGASEEQSSAIGNIAMAIQEIDQVTHITSELSRESEGHSQKLNEQSSELKEAMTSLYELVHGEKR